MSDTFNIEGGKYWIGDPCYILSDEDYDAMIDSQRENFDHGGYDYQYELRGHTITVLHTAHGDGEYPSVLGYVSVDSGQIAAVPYDLIRNHDPNELATLGATVSLPEGEAYCENGELFFSNISILTEWPEEDYEEVEGC